MFISWEEKFCEFRVSGAIRQSFICENQPESVLDTTTFWNVPCIYNSYQILPNTRNGLACSFEGAEVLPKSVYPLSMDAPVLTITAANSEVKLEMNSMAGDAVPLAWVVRPFHSQIEGTDKKQDGNHELWTPPCNSATHSSCHVLLSFSDRDH